VSYDSLYFAFFLTVVWLAFELLPWRGAVLLVASIVFYSVAGVRDSVLAGAIILVNYGFQFAIVRDRRWLYPALAFNFGCLAYFKYRVFLAGVAGSDLFAGGIVIPLGISFYVFQLSAFLIDISRGHASAFTSLPRFALFKLFFGQLVAGPIMRWREFGPQVNRIFDGKAPVIGRRMAGLGLGLCLLGLTKKLLLADSIAPFVDAIFHDGPADAGAAWLGAWLFAFQIYFDFSGYSDIALGLGHIFGFRLARNFDTPFRASSIQELWQRWHMTLTRFLRDYVFLPLADIRVLGRRYRVVQYFGAMVLTMTLCGLWHGAGWNFIIWGTLQGLAMVFAVAWQRNLPSPPAWAAWAVTFTFFLLTLVFFRADDIGSAVSYLGAIFGLHGAGSARVPQDGAGGILIVAGCLALLALHWWEGRLFTRGAVRVLLRFDGVFLRALFAGMSIWLLIAPKVQDNPFIYFRF
jgi:D-alanyl-lipoteichoic acid acyltransferase DltB (MBOAT superfamily)